MIAEGGRSDYIQEVTCDGQPDHPPHHSVTVASSITSLWIVSQYYQVSLTYVSEESIAGMDCRGFGQERRVQNILRHDYLGVIVWH